MTFHFQAPDLAEFPRRSYRRFLEETLGNLFAEISPVGSEFSNRFEISFVGGDGKCHWKFEDYAIDSGYPTTSEAARKTNMTHARRMLMEVWLRDTQTGELRKSTAYIADVPVITDRGTFVINGSERVVLGQLVRAPGIYYSSPMPSVFKCLMLAEQGAPISLEMELDPMAAKTSRAKCRIKLPKRSWIACTTLLLAMGIDIATIQKKLGPLLEKNRIDWKQMTQNEALAIVGRGWKPDGGGGVGAGNTALKELTDKRRYSLGSLGRKRINTKLRIEGDSLQLTADDVFAAVEYILGLSLGHGEKDNIDSLENRHLRGVGDVLTKAVRPALSQMARSIRTRLELNEDEEIGSPNDLVDTRPFANAINKFFSGNPLVQYLDQQNPLSELSHRRRITSFGPGGIDPNAAPVEMRDVHPSQIGRMCLIESPEGKNCGMVSYMATFCRIDDDGFMTVPYRKVAQGKLTEEVQFITPAEDKLYALAPPDTQVDENGCIIGPFVSARRGERFMEVTPQEVDMIGIAPQGFISVGSALIPFLEHDDANRALMGGGMMRQTLPLIKPERPRVGTGMEKIVARSSGCAIAARRAGTVSRVTGSEIIITQASGEERNYPLVRYDRTNQNTILDQRPAVKEGQKIDAGQIIADGPAIDNGELALGRNLLIAFLSWRGQNYEDAMVVREGLIRDNKLTHIEIEKHSIGVHQTLRGPEILTPELPNVANTDLEHLDERGIAKIGSYVKPGDILVSKLGPKEQRALSAEEELLQAIFGKVAEEMADTSLRVPHGSGGRVIDVRIFTPETTPELKAGVICEIEVLIARLCPLEVGDKLAGRHGNKGIVSIVVPDQDMPYLPDGTPVDIVLNPLGVPSRMNVGQVFDTQLGLYSQILNRYYRIHQFDESVSPDASFNLVNSALAEVRKTPGFEWMQADGKVPLFDGRTGELFDRPVLVGRQYMLKLNQLVLHKINARSGLGGPYAAVTQQPVGGKANHGGQRMGEMEVWAIQAYGAAHVLNEMMTIKADDIQGRHQSYADIVQGNNISEPGRTAAFDGLCCELRGLGMEVTLGRIVDSFEPIADKSCVQAEAPKSLEEEYMVSSVDQLERDGVKMLEIPAGDYVPSQRTPQAPIITSLTVGKNGAKAKVEISNEPLAISDPEATGLLDAFISNETKDIIPQARQILGYRPIRRNDIDERFVVPDDGDKRKLERKFVVPEGQAEGASDNRFVIPDDEKGRGLIDNFVVSDDGAEVDDRFGVIDEEAVKPVMDDRFVIPGDEVVKPVMDGRFVIPEDEVVKPVMGDRFVIPEDEVVKPVMDDQFVVPEDGVVKPVMDDRFVIPEDGLVKPVMENCFVTPEDDNDVVSGAPVSLDQRLISSDGDDFFAPAPDNGSASRNIGRPVPPSAFEDDDYEDNFEPEESFEPDAHKAGSGTPNLVESHADAEEMMVNSISILPKDSLLTDFPSLTELESLASELMNMSMIDDDTVSVAAKGAPVQQGEESHNQGNFSMDGEQ